MTPLTRLIRGVALATPAYPLPSKSATNRELSIELVSETSKDAQGEMAPQLTLHRPPFIPNTSVAWPPPQIEKCPKRSSLTRLLEVLARRNGPEPAEDLYQFAVVPSAQRISANPSSLKSPIARSLMGADVVFRRSQAEMPPPETIKSFTVLATTSVRPSPSKLPKTRPSIPSIR